MLGELEEAKANTRQGLNARRVCLGDRHADTAESLEGVGLLLAAEGDTAGALANYTEALGIYEGVSDIPTTHACRKMHGNTHTPHT